MKVIKTDQVITFDCDDTLIMWHTSNPNITIIDPYDSVNHNLEIHSRHVKLLTDHFQRGYHVVVWSANGYQWAEAVVKALGIQDSVHTVMSKPLKYVDDLVANEFMGTRIYLENK